MKTILLVEDDEFIRNLVRNMLEKEKYTCLIAENGLDGVALAKKYLPDVIISDVLMPEMDGFSLKQQLSGEPATALIPFIFLTSMTDRDFIRKGMTLGADDYLFKPVKPSELSEAIQSQLEKREQLLLEYSKNAHTKVEAQPESHEYLLIKDKGTPRFIRVNDIALVSADEKYTIIFLASREKVLVSRTMQEWENILPKSVFIRIHRSHIVNLTFIEKTEKWFNRSYRLKIRNREEPVYISKRFYSKLRDIF